MIGHYSRRDLIRSLCGGLGSIGLAGMLADEQARAAAAHTAGPHFTPTAKHNISLFLGGGPSELDMFDPKPSLAKYPGQRPSSPAGILPSEHQGTQFNDAAAEPDKIIRYLQNKDLDRQQQRRQLDLVQALNRGHEQSFGEDEFLEGRIRAMETAYSMQFEALDVFDL